MDENPKSFARKQRQKNQRYKSKPQEKRGEPPSSSPDVDNNSSNPQPQRANRRQRNEPATTSVNNEGESTQSTNKDNKETTEKENVTIDFSNLKRETEEIAKLTQKFAKRNISSNWHRYSAPEGAEDEEKMEEETPADFSALIQVPASKGGHLQLKDEQEWSLAAGDKLGGYFALNLKLLSQSLACVPIYKQLHLPKHMFTEEERKHLDDLAIQAKKAYNPDKIEDPNSKVMKTMNLLLRRPSVDEEPKCEEDIKISSDVFNILDVQGSNQKLLNIKSEANIIPVNSLVGNANFDESGQVPLEAINTSYSKSNKEVENSVQANNKNCLNSENQFLGEIAQNRLSLSNNETSLSGNETLETEKLSLMEERSSPLPKRERPELSEPISQTSIVHKTAEGVNQTVGSTKHGGPNENNDFTKESSVNTTKEIPQVNNSNPGSITTSEPKDKRTRKNRTQVKLENENNMSMEENTVKLEEEDDDDLDFLLSLKQPILPENKKNVKPVPNKDSSFLPGNGISPQPASTEQHSELDDWLDSVLQD